MLFQPWTEGHTSTCGQSKMASPSCPALNFRCLPVQSLLGAFGKGGFCSVLSWDLQAAQKQGGARGMAMHATCSEG